MDAVNPESGKASASGESVTFSVKSNSGNDREGYIVFSTGLARAAFKIIQKGEAGELTPGSGTKEDPYSVAGALAVAKPLTYTDQNNYQKIEGVYIKGKISTVTQDYTYNVSNGNTFGNARFNISDSGTKADEFICYNIYYLGNKKFVAGQTDIKEGDDVIVFGNIMNYKGNTPEFESGKCYLYSLNGTSEEASGGGDERAAASGAGTEADPYNVSAALGVAEKLTYTSSSNYQKVENVFVKGKISALGEFSSEFGNYTYTLADEGFSAGMDVYRGFYFDGAKFTAKDQLKVGDVVVVNGFLMNYKGNTPQIGQGSKIVELNGQKPEVKPTVEGTVSEIVAAEKNSPVIVNDAIVAALTQKGFMLTDGAKNLYAYEDKAPTVKIGDKVKVEGKLIDYYGLPEVSEISKVTTLTSNNEVSRTALTDITATLDSYNSAHADYITLTGKLVKSDTYYNITVEGKEWMGSASQPSSEISGKLDLLLNRDVKVTGYYNTRNTGKKIVNIIVTDVVAASEYYCYPDNKTIKVKADVTSAEIKITANSAWTLTARGDITLSDATGTAGSEISGSADATVTATFAANESTETNNVYTLVLVCEAASVNETITITQSKVSAEGADKYVLDGAAIKAAHSAAWSYTSGEKTITATDGSVWTCFNTYGNKNQVTVQMNKGKSAYVLTPALPSGKEVKTISVVLNKSNAGTGDMGDRPMDILSADGTATLLDNVTGQDLADGLPVAAGHSQVRIICDEKDGGSVYITEITVTF